MFRISLLLWMIAFAALNLTLLRSLETIIGFSPSFIGLFGLMPLFDFFALSLYLALTRKFRFALVRRHVRKRFVDSAAVVSGAILALGALLCLFFPDAVLKLLELLFSPLLQSSELSKSPPEIRGIRIGGLLGAIMSGPMICVTLIFSLIHSRFRLEITRRGEE
ncbi:hypothetical protein SAMN05444166_0080 [Singulisphaera sp. GP187]|uniref:hypothetical protein n=1 Tax=Singulisphaera sp. GP187 TaxID=1882752 RepID=UPI000925DBB9|nr:hypothetical protein [Singulisphaera sp. GP187]SIN68336.1 hypothetical protein SAMN05444166_0080 [Singulisphaera sp. GP187]